MSGLALGGTCRRELKMLTWHLAARERGESDTLGKIAEYEPD